MIRELRPALVIFGLLTVVTGMLDFGLDPQQALDAPRVFFGEDGLVAEPSLPPSVARDLETMGHRVSFSEDPHGGGQIIRFDRARGVLEGGSDPRKDGLALGI